jgi:microcystin-dependent protein
MTSVLRRTSAFTAHEKPTVGDTKTSFVTLDHLGWLRCDGRQVSKAEYGILFNVIGYTFGGSGSNFNLPNAQGRVVGHVGSNYTDPSSNYVAGDLSGQDQITLTIPQLPAHDHTGLTGISGEHIHETNDNPPSIGLAQRTNSNTATTFDSSTGELDLINAAALEIYPAGSHRHTIASQGSGLPISVMQPTIFMGNLFIYCGVPPKGVWPYTTGTNIY